MAEDFNGFSAAFAENLDNVLVDYNLKLLLTIPVWCVFFQRLPHWSLWQKIMPHLVTLPLFVFGWQALYYQVADAFELGRLRSNARIWDTYITMLFYPMPFGLFHANAYYRNYQKQREREAALRELTLKSELAALKAQPNPQFLYNVFNTISASVPPAQEHNREMLAHLSDIAHPTLCPPGAGCRPRKPPHLMAAKRLLSDSAKVGWANTPNCKVS